MGAQAVFHALRSCVLDLAVLDLASYTVVGQLSQKVVVKFSE